MLLSFLANCRKFQEIRRRGLLCHANFRHCLASPAIPCRHCPVDIDCCRERLHSKQMNSDEDQWIAQLRPFHPKPPDHSEHGVGYAGRGAEVVLTGEFESRPENTPGHFGVLRVRATGATFHSFLLESFLGFSQVRTRSLTLALQKVRDRNKPEPSLILTQAK